jgi:hypothetical protein
LIGHGKITCAQCHPDASAAGVYAERDWELATRIAGAIG